MEGIDDLTDVTATLSLPLRSSTVLRCSARVLRFMGIELIAATPLTSMLPLVLSHRIKKEGGPAEMKSADPDTKASIMADGPPMFDQLTLTLTPCISACFSTRLLVFMMCKGKKPKPPAPIGTRISETSACAMQANANQADSIKGVRIFFIDVSKKFIPIHAESHSARTCTLSLLSVGKQSDA